MGANGGGGSLGSDSAVCVRRYGRGRRESSHDPVLSSGLDSGDPPSQNWHAVPYRVSTLPIRINVEEVDKYWMRTAANLVQP